MLQSSEIFVAPELLFPPSYILLADESSFGSGIQYLDSIRGFTRARIKYLVPEPIPITLYFIICSLKKSAKTLISKSPICADEKNASQSHTI